MVRKNDFRASGSLNERYEKEVISKEVIRQAFEISEKLKNQCIVFDFLFLNGKPMVVEISYGTTVTAYDQCPGYFDKDLNWHDDHFDHFGMMVEEVIYKNSTCNK